MRKHNLSGEFIQKPQKKINNFCSLFTKSIAKVNKISYNIFISF